VVTAEHGDEVDDLEQASSLRQYAARVGGQGVVVPELFNVYQLAFFAETYDLILDCPLGLNRAENAMCNPLT